MMLFLRHARGLTARSSVQVRRPWAAGRPRRLPAGEGSSPRANLVSATVALMLGLGAGAAGAPRKTQFAPQSAGCRLSTMAGIPMSLSTPARSDSRRIFRCGTYARESVERGWRLICSDRPATGSAPIAARNQEHHGRQVLRAV